MSPALCVILFLTHLATLLAGAWLYHAAQSGRSPLPPNPFRRRLPSVEGEPDPEEDAKPPKQAGFYSSPTEYLSPEMIERERKAFET